MSNKDKNPGNELNYFILYTAPSGEVRIEIYIQNETIWLTQQKIAELFGVDRTVVTKHLKNIFEDAELDKESVSAIFAHTAADGKKYDTNFYNLDAIISVGYRVNSTKATQFRIWATKTLIECNIVEPASSSLWVNETNLLKNLLLCSKVLYLCITNAIKAFSISCQSAFFPDCNLTKDNTPSRLTSVAHLGGLFFYKPLAI